MNVFPNYWTARDTKQTTMKKHYVYPKMNIDGEPAHVVDRTHYNKLDRIKVYTEEMLKIANMRKGAQRENKKKA